MKKVFLGCAWTIIGFLVLLLGIGIFMDSDPDVSEEEAEVDQTEEREPELNTQMRYVHNQVNVRSEPSTNSEIVEELNRGSSLNVLVDSVDNDWMPVVRDSVHGYVHADLVEEQPLPDIEVEDFTWRTDPSFGTEGVVRWVVEVRNNTGRYVDSVQLRFSTYDADGNIITSTSGFVNNIRPHGTSSTESYADYYGVEDRARIEIENTRYSR